MGSIVKKWRMRDEAAAWGVPEIIPVPPRAGAVRRAFLVCLCLILLLGALLLATSESWAQVIVTIVIVGLLGWPVAGTAWRIARVARARARGAPLRGRVSRVRRDAKGGSYVSVDFDAGPRASGGVHRWFGMGATKGVVLERGQHVTMWGARTSWRTGRPKGPWVLVDSTAEPRLMLPGWLRLRRPRDVREDQRALYDPDR